MAAHISHKEFSRLEIRVGTITGAEPASGTRQPAYQLTIDFGGFGQRSSSAQLTDHYEPSDLIGRQVIALVNLPPKRIAGFVSEVLVLGAYEPDGSVRLLQPDSPVENGSRLQ